MSLGAGDLSLTPLEVATGIVYGTISAPLEVRRTRCDGGPLAVIERACISALELPPCLVSFSGGRDSSLVLAVAARVARREGLAPPIPATNLFPEAGDTDESAWQELVVRQLGLDDWLRLSFTDELDAVGPVATRALRRHGLLWPFNSHFHAPLLEAASGGSLLTGIGGDEVLGDSRWARATAVLSGIERPLLRDAPRIALLISPPPLRRAVLARRPPVRFPWLTDEGQREFARRWAADQGSEPFRLAPRLTHLQRLRMLRVGLHSLDLLAADAGAAIGHPLATPEFGQAVAAATGWRGFEDRTLAMRALFPGVLPPQLLSRRTKARFDGAFWGAHSRALAAAWNGEGADPSVVDPEVLRSIWSCPQPNAHTYLMLQAAWVEGALTSCTATGVPNSAT